MQHTPQQAVAYADLYVANDQDPNFLFQNNGEDHFLEVALISGVCYNDMGKEEAGMGTDFGDYNNDGWLDLTVSNYQTETNTVYHNYDGTFANVMSEGDLDILVTNCNQRPDLLQNTVGNRNNWIQIQAVREKIVPIR